MFRYSLHDKAKFKEVGGGGGGAKGRGEVETVVILCVPEFKLFGSDKSIAVNITQWTRKERLATRAELPAVIVPPARAEECAVGLWSAVHKLSG